MITLFSVSGCGLFDSDEKEKVDGDELLQFHITQVATMSFSEFEKLSEGTDYPSIIEIRKNSIGVKPEGRIKTEISGWLEMQRYANSYMPDWVFIDVEDIHGMETIQFTFENLSGDSLTGRLCAEGRLIDAFPLPFTAKK